MVGSKMTNRCFFQSFVAAAALLVAAGSAHATTNVITDLSQTYVYSTFFDVPSVSSALHFSDAANSFGGLCANNVTPCANEGVPQGDTAGPLNGGTASPMVPGTIEIATPSAIANYKLTLTIQATEGEGDIYDIVVNGNNVGTTSIVAFNATGSSAGTFTSVVSGGNGALISVSVTDLLQQYLGSSNYDLPSLLCALSTTCSNNTTAKSNAQADDNQSGLGACSVNSTNCFDAQSQFVLSATLVPDPEPASLSIFALGSLALGAARRRRRAKAQKSAA
jgi:hypothetical protein